MAHVVSLEEPPRETGGIGISHSVYELRKRNIICTATWKGSCLEVDEWKHLTSGANNDVIATDVR